MVNPLPVYKMVAAGNDFVVLDVRGVSGLSINPSEASALAARLCRRRLDIGADGLMLLGDPAEAGHAFSMKYYNADGSHGGACGNGARSLAWLARHLGIWREQVVFGTDAGTYRAESEGGNRLSIGMSDGHFIERGVRIEELADLGLDWLDTGVPHVVVWVESPKALAAYPVSSVGRMLRYHSQFAPAGTNANFVAEIRPRAGDQPPLLAIRTYERGVEGETLGCGTGCVASAACQLAREGLASGTVDLRTESGEVLRATISLEGAALRDVKLTGEARLVFTGTVPQD